MKYVLLVAALTLVPSMSFATAKFAKDSYPDKKCADCHGKTKKAEDLTEFGKTTKEAYCKANPGKCK